MNFRSQFSLERRIRNVTALAAATLLCAAVLTAPHAADAKQYPQYVKDACKRDFKKYCPSYDIESAALRSCMRAVADDLSRRCYEALERSGERRRR